MMNENYQSGTMCVCGDTDEMHVDGQEQCFIPECGCKEFEEKEEITT